MAVVQHKRGNGKTIKMQTFIVSLVSNAVSGHWTFQSWSNKPQEAVVYSDAQSAFIAVRKTTENHRLMWLTAFIGYYIYLAKAHNINTHKQKILIDSSTKQCSFTATFSRMVARQHRPSGKRANQASWEGLKTGVIIKMCFFFHH